MAANMKLWAYSPEEIDNQLVTQMELTIVKKFKSL